MTIDQKVRTQLEWMDNIPKRGKHKRTIYYKYLNELNVWMKNTNTSMKELLLRNFHAYSRRSRTLWIEGFEEIKVMFLLLSRFRFFQGDKRRKKAQKKMVLNIKNPNIPSQRGHLLQGFMN